MVGERTAEQQANLDALAREVTELRPLPAIVMRLLRMVQDPRFSAQDLAQTVGADSALTVAILRTANSSFYGMPRRISSIRDAVVLLGFLEVRKLALASCMAHSAAGRDTGPLGYNEFWRNSLAVGLLAEVLAGAEGEDSDGALTAGVVHNMGRLAFAQMRPEEFGALLRTATSQGKPLHEVQQASLGFTDADLGAAIIRRWEFPTPLCDAVAHHAAPMSSFASRHDLDSIVARARRFARAKGLTDGVDAPSLLAPDLEWQDPRVENRLRRAGDFAGIIQLVDSLIAQAA